jgi:hypothetical protein
VIGVTGHRDLRPEDVPALESRVREILVGLQVRYRATPLVLLSALAEGADRLVARVALELGYRLIVPLPMPPEEYRRDFPETAAEFDALLARADKSFTLAELGDVDAASKGRRHCYAVAGAFIARHSQILLALWDGKDQQKIGGTAHVVRFKREGVDEPFGPPRSPLDLVEGGPVYHLVTPRQSDPAPAGKPLALVKLFPLDQATAQDRADKAHHRVFAWMNQLNRDAVRLGAALEPERRKSQDYVFPQEEAEKLPGAVRSSLFMYSIADSLSIHFARRMLWTLRILLVLAFAAALVFQIYAYLPSKPRELLVGYLALAYVFGPALYLWARFAGDYQNKYLDYRALAEGLRVLIFWRLAGLKIQVADHYLRKQRSEMDWIRQAIRVWTIPMHRDADALAQTPSDADRLRLALKHWVEDQAAFYVGRSKKDAARARWYGCVGIALYALGLVLPAIKLFSEGETPLIVAMSVTVVVAALVHLYSQVLGFAEHASQYERMQHIFGKGVWHLRSLLDAGRLEEAQKLIGDLGQEALIENGEWLLFHRRRPVEVPGLGGS